MLWRVEVRNKSHIFDAVGEGLKKDINDLGVKNIAAVRMVQLYWLEGDINESQIRLIAEKLLCDKVVQDYRFANSELEAHSLPEDPVYRVVEVAYHPGVMDPWVESTLKGVKELGVKGIREVRTSRKYLVKGKISQRRLGFIAEKLLYNKVIQHMVTDYSVFKKKPLPYVFHLTHVDLLRASPRKLMEISKRGHLFLDLAEMRQIQKFFQRLKRNPIDCELETIAQTWSEHCGHKTIKSRIEYTEIDAARGLVKKETINNLLKSTIIRATRELDKPWCVSVFKDNAGIIRFDQDFNICFKVETHNHPSALEPYGGAGTGIGGVIRDILGAGLGAKPIMNTDVFCFGLPDYPYKKLPSGTLHPKRIMKGVVAGVRDYGNRMGIPTANGAVLFDERFTGNPLVYCGTVGIIPKDKCLKHVRPGDKVVLVGGKTGRDGIHGATFSSDLLTSESEVVSSGAVQIGNPITEKKVLDALLLSRDQNLYSAITDCGGGGLSSAIGEIGSVTGVKVHLDKVPLKYAGLSYTEIWISESQERMILAVPQKNVEKLLNVFKQEDVEATVIGDFTRTKHLELFYNHTRVADLSMEFLHNGLPQVTRQAVWKKPCLTALPRLPGRDFTRLLEKALAHGNICSKEWIIRQYDHEVQAGTIVKPLVGIAEDGPGDAAVIKPLPNSKKGVIVSCGINTKYGLIDPYWMAAGCIDEALRQIISVGGSLDQVGILDNFSWGNTRNPERLGELVRACRGCYDFSKGFGVPFISGKDSLNNEYTLGKKTISIPPTLLISAMAVMPDVSRAITADLKEPGNFIYLIGNTRRELGGSIYDDILGLSGNDVPQVDIRAAKAAMRALSQAIRKGFVRACHDLSDGGLGVAAAEMAFAGGLGMEIDLASVPASNSLNDAELLFSESHSRFIVEVPPRHRRLFEKYIGGVPHQCLGRVTKNKYFKVRGTNGKILVQAGISVLKQAWQKPLNW